MLLAVFAIMGSDSHEQTSAATHQSRPQSADTRSIEYTAPAREHCTRTVMGR